MARFVVKNAMLSALKDEDLLDSNYRRGDILDSDDYIGRAKNKADKDGNHYDTTADRNKEVQRYLDLGAIEPELVAATFIPVEAAIAATKAAK